jgi:hypothetical protein
MEFARSLAWALDGQQRMSRMSDRIPARIAYVALAAGTIAVGLWVHRGGSSLGADARDGLSAVRAYLLTGPSNPMVAADSRAKTLGIKPCLSKTF